MQKQSDSMQGQELKNSSVKEPLLEDPEIQDKQDLNNIFQFKKHIFYLFINPKSGNNEGSLLLNIPQNPLVLDISNKRLRKKQINFQPTLDKYNVEFFMINLCSTESQKEGVEHLKNNMGNLDRHISAITCGGDGTVMWVSEVLHKNGIDLDKLPIGMMGLGTGNDFSRALGWGPAQNISGLLKNEYKGLKKLALRWIQANLSDFDIWDIKFETFEQGYFTVIKQINGKPVEKKIEDSDGNPEQVIRKTFCNYFSVGIDARIGVDFDRGRTKSRLGNLCVYCWASMKRLFSCTNPELGHEMASLETYKNVEHSHMSQQNRLSYQSNRVSQNLEDVGFEDEQQIQKDRPSSIDYFANNDNTEQIFRTRTAQSFNQDMDNLKQLQKQDNQEYQNKINDQNKFLNGSPKTILILNINSYAAGATNIWAKGAKKGALVDIEQKKKLQQSQQFSKQLFSDGKIEIISFQHFLQLGLEQIWAGNSNRVAQGAGPFRFNFREKNKKGELITSYFQIDGEYFIVTSPKQIIIKKSTKVPHGKIKVLVEEQQYQKIQNQQE